MKKPKRKIRMFTSFLVPIVIVAVPILLFFNGCKSDYSSITFAIEEKGQIYLYNPNEYLVHKAVEKNEVPIGLNTNIIFLKDDEVFMRPNNLLELTNILSGNYKLIEKKELNYHGYAVRDSLTLHHATVLNKASDKIGKTETINSVTLTNKSNNPDSMIIKWTTIPEPKALENCSLEGVWKTTNPYPGKTVTNWEDEILVKLKDINSFYGTSFELFFDEDTSVLYFKKRSKN